MRYVPATMRTPSMCSRSTNILALLTLVLHNVLPPARRYLRYYRKGLPARLHTQTGLLAASPSLTSLLPTGVVPATASLAGSALAIGERIDGTQSHAASTKQGHVHTDARTHPLRTSCVSWRAETWASKSYGRCNVNIPIRAHLEVRAESSVEAHAVCVCACKLHNWPTFTHSRRMHRRLQLLLSAVTRAVEIEYPLCIVTQIV